VVEDSRFGGLRRPRVVVAGNCVKQLGAGVRLQPDRVFLDQPRPQVDVPEQAPFGGLPKTWTGHELCGASDVVEERGGE
jgi:hypothetical protein